VRAPRGRGAEKEKTTIEQHINFTKKFIIAPLI